MAGDSASLRLRQAIILDDLELVRRILNNNLTLLYNPAYDEKSNTSLHLAASLGLYSISQYLIRLGHDSSAIFSDDISSVEASHGISINTDGQSPLHVASSYLHTSVVQLLCEQFPSTINRKDKKGRTPLLLAARSQAKSHTSTSTSSNPKPTVRAAEDVSTIETLLEFGADVMTKDSRGNTCLHYACAFGNLKAIRALMQAGADPLAMNFEGWKPELYSLTVQAEVYYRNLVSDLDKRKAEEQRIMVDRQGKGGLRLVGDDDETDLDELNSLTGRSRADSGRSDATFESAMS